MFKIGDRVRLINTGENATGTVEGIATASFYLESSSLKPEVFLKWNELYPGWADELIVFIKYDSPQKPVTIDEIFWTLPPGFSYNVAEYIYYEKTPVYNRCYTPAKDVELIDD